jgi:hypothetical protein
MCSRLIHAPTLPQVAYLAREREKGDLIRIMSPYSIASLGEEVSARGFYLLPPAKPRGFGRIRPWPEGRRGHAVFVTLAPPPHPRFAVLPPDRFAGGRVNCSPACGGAGWRSQTEGGCAFSNKHRRPHPPCGVLPPDRFAGGRGSVRRKVRSHLGPLQLGAWALSKV